MLPSSLHSVKIRASRSSCACALHSTSIPKTNGKFISTTKNRIVIQKLLLNQTGILHVVVPYIWDPFGNLTVLGLQSATGSYKACTSALGAKLLDAKGSTKKSTVLQYIWLKKKIKLPHTVVSLAVSTIVAAASGHARLWLSFFALALPGCFIAACFKGQLRFIYPNYPHLKQQILLISRLPLPSTLAAPNSIGCGPVAGLADSVGGYCYRGGYPGSCLWGCSNSSKSRASLLASSNVLGSHSCTSARTFSFRP